MGERVERSLDARWYEAAENDRLTFCLNEQGSCLTIMRWLKVTSNNAPNLVELDMLLNAMAKLGAYAYVAIRLGRLTGPKSSRYSMLVSGTGPNFYDPPVVRTAWNKSLLEAVVSQW